MQVRISWRRRRSGRHPAGAARRVSPVTRVPAAAHARRQAGPPGHLHVPDNHARSNDPRPSRQGQADAGRGGRKFEAGENLRLNRDTYDPEKGQPSAGYPPRSQGGVLSYNDFWYERGNQLVDDRRTSLIIDPPDGRVPLAPRAEPAGRGRRPLTTRYNNLSLADRCLLGFNSGPR